ncbi:hypothetical protein, partial [Streptomyces sp. NPDC058461]|uniref:hypothetical protein n=1 Tax=Streptomyces sp. NPDC058461 TaxID=3346509 RepID=UPI0036477676
MDGGLLPRGTQVRPRVHLVAGGHADAAVPGRTARALASVTATVFARAAPVRALARGLASAGVGSAGVAVPLGGTPVVVRRAAAPPGRRRDRETGRDLVEAARLAEFG